VHCIIDHNDFWRKEPIGRAADSLPEMQSYHGYSIHLERMSSAWRCSVSPMTNDLPILARYCFKHPTKAAALDQAKLRIDKLLAHERLSMASADSQEPKGENKA
jgi:hypothetical protein